LPGAVSELLGNPEKIADERWRSASQAFHNGDLSRAADLLPPHCRTEREVIRALLRKPGNWAGAVKSIHPRLINLYLSAAQSWLFDRAVAARIATLDRVVPGDVAWKHDNGACFLVTDGDEAAERAAVFAISPTGPMFGRKMLLADGDAAILEDNILAGAGLARELFNGTGRFSLDGERRPLRVPLSESSFTLTHDSLTLKFLLPKGSYATALLREVMKNAGGSNHGE
jgi:tRNA pseudouridine13 synthase